MRTSFANLLILIAVSCSQFAFGQTLGFNRIYYTPDSDDINGAIGGKAVILDATLWSRPLPNPLGQRLQDLFSFRVLPTSDTLPLYKYDAFRDSAIASPILTTNNGYWVLGYHLSPTPIGFSSGFYFLARHFFGGPPLFKKDVVHVGYRNGNNLGLVYQAIEGPDNGIIILGTRRNFPAGNFNNLHPYLMRFDSLGNKVAEQDYYLPENYQPYSGSLAYMEDGALIFTSYINRNYGPLGFRRELNIHYINQDLTQRRLIVPVFRSSGFWQLNGFEPFFALPLPGNKIFLSAYERHSWPNRSYNRVVDTSFTTVYLKDTSTYAKFVYPLSDGNIVLVIDSGDVNKRFVRKWNYTTGTFTTPVVIDASFDPQVLYSVPQNLVFDDSGNVYSFGIVNYNDPNNTSDIWLAKVNNVGYPYIAYSPNGNYPVGTKPEISVKEVFAYPNPANSTLRFSGLPWQEGLQIRFYESSGKLALQTTYPPSGDVPLTGLPSGLYQWQVLLPNGSVRTGRVVKE